MKETAERFWKAVMEHRWFDAYDECQLSWQSKYPLKREGASEIEGMFGHLVFDDVEIGGGVHLVEVVADVVAVLRCEKLILCSRITRLIREDAAYKTSETGTWGVNPLSALRNE